MIKIIFAGTPEFASGYLQALLGDSRFNVAGVITQADKPSGRNHKIIFSPVKMLAQERGLPIFQPEKLKSDTALPDELRKLDADLMIVVAYGQIIPLEILRIPRLGAINVHPSLLPKYRGASPVQSAILNGEAKTGVTIMLMDEKTDHGPILAQLEHGLSGEETNAGLHRELADLSYGLLLDTATGFAEGKIKPVEQDHAQATYCKTITKENARIDWSLDAEEIKRKVYAFDPWPGTWTTLEAKRLKIFPPVEVNDFHVSAEPGQIMPAPLLTVACLSGSLTIHKIQLEGKKEMSAGEFMRGYKDLKGKKLL